VPPGVLEVFVLSDFFADAYLAPTKYLRFENVPNPGKKTGIWEVVSYRDAALGRILWFGSWRQYSFQPYGSTVFNAECLADITDRIETCNRWQRNIQANRRAAS